MKDIFIRRMTLEDVVFTNTTRNLVLKYLHHQDKQNLEEAESWFKKTNPLFYIIENKEDTDTVSLGYFRTSNHSRKNKNIYLGADIHPDYWGHGVAQKAYPLMLDTLFTELDLNKVSLEVLETNLRAIHVFT